MANFDVQIQDLVGSFSDQTAMDSWMTDGAKEIINIFPPELLEECLGTTTLNNSSPTYNLDTATNGKVLSLSRSDGTYNQICRKIPGHLSSRVQNPDDIEFASKSDPVYYSKAGTISVYPTPTASETAEVLHVVYPSIDASAGSSIAKFPEEAEYLVVIYAAIKALQQNLNTTMTNNDIGTALTAIKAEIDECLTIADNMHTQIGNAITEIAEAVAITDTSSSDINTALAAAATAMGKFRAASGDPVLFGSENQYESSVGLAHVKDALTNAKNIIDDGANSPTGNAAGDAATYLYTEEDIELMNGALGIAKTEISRAQTHIAEWSTVVQTLSAEVTGFINEAQGRYGWITAKGTVWGGYFTAAQNYGGEITSKLAIAQGYTSEATIRMQRDEQTFKWYLSQQQALKDDYRQGIQMLLGKYAKKKEEA
tara:strand:+ start:1488 stop:2768 length:1281 start_codon:yes stop_codon:yes gene_type:complete